MGGLVGFSLKNAQIVTADKIIKSMLVINHGKIAKIIEGDLPWQAARPPQGGRTPL